ncbi:MAG TPA: hypothetical protein PKG48_15945 [Bacteroidales bacterium]|nr:hypothetical protein [Bacteroidales bacterium]HPS63417.1 hypothetical protein [Bacteroidales bacterium]
MVLLTIYYNTRSEAGEGLPRETLTYFENSIEEAVRTGQASGCFYEILDMITGRAIDWNEVNYREEEEWYYDEHELIWKKQGEHPSRTLKLVILPVGEHDHVQAGLSLPVSYHH